MGGEEGEEETRDQFLKTILVSRIFPVTGLVSCSDSQRSMAALCATGNGQHRLKLKASTTRDKQQEIKKTPAKDEQAGVVDFLGQARQQYSLFDIMLIVVIAINYLYPLIVDCLFARSISDPRTRRMPCALHIQPAKRQPLPSELGHKTNNPGNMRPFPVSPFTSRR